VPASRFPDTKKVLVGALAAAAVFALVVWLGAHNQSEDESTARSTAGHLLSAASDWKRNVTLRGCPTISQLQVDRQLERDALTQDPWGQRFRILCKESGVEVLSAGADREFQTGDDIRLAGDGHS
jgi:hypothetical protein